MDRSKYERTKDELPLEGRGQGDELHLEGAWSKLLSYKANVEVADTKMMKSFLWPQVY